MGHLQPTAVDETLNDEKGKTNDRDEDGTTGMGLSLVPEHRRKDDISVEANVEPIAMVMRRRRLERFRHVKSRDET